MSPLIDPDKVNKRQAEVGLETLPNYVSHWNIIWDLEKYKERTKKS